MEIPYKREKAANYSMEENSMLYNLYKQNYNLYHCKHENGSRKEGARMRELLLADWCRILTSLGVARREPSKIAEKIKKDFQTARYMIKNYREQLMNGPSGELIHPRASHPHLVPLFDIIEGVEVSKTDNGNALNEVKPFDVPLPRVQSLLFPITTDASREIVVPRPIQPMKSDIIMPIPTRQTSPSISPVDTFDLEIKRLKKRKLELEVELLEKQIKYQDQLGMREERASQPTTSNSSANSLPLPIIPPVAHSDFHSIFRTFQSNIKSDQFGFQ